MNEASGAIELARNARIQKDFSGVMLIRLLPGFARNMAR